jgi:hypothetical protein
MCKSILVAIGEVKHICIVLIDICSPSPASRFFAAVSRGHLVVLFRLPCLLHRALNAEITRAATDTSRLHLRLLNFHHCEMKRVSA